MSVPLRINKQITIVAGTPVRLAPWYTAVNRLFIQQRAGGTGLIYVLAGIPDGTTPSAANAAHLTAELGASPSAAQPGGSFGDPPGGAGGWNQTPPVDISEIWIDGSHSGDVVIVSFERRI